MEINEINEKNLFNVSIKINKEIFDKIKEQAKSELRSINKQATYLLVLGLKYLEETESAK